jgi:hypothetical protein
MFVMHHGFRRDLRDLAAAIPATPVDEHDVWRALQRRWQGTSTALHHHHHVEDDALWPPLLERLRSVADHNAVSVVEAVADEHAGLAPVIQACADGFGSMVLAPSRAGRDHLAAAVGAMRPQLLAHLDHEEVAVLPLVQHVSVASWDEVGAAAREEYGLADIAFAVPSSVLEIPPDEFTRAYAHGGPLVRAILVLTRRRFRREHRVAFRHPHSARGARVNVGSSSPQHHSTTTSTLRSPGPRCAAPRER